MRVDPLWCASADRARARLGPDAAQADVLWAAAIIYLFATGLLADSNVSRSVH